MELTKTTLEDGRVRLEPLDASHRSGLSEAVRDGELWNIRETIVPPPELLGAFVEDAERAFGQGRELAFCVVDASSGRVVGSTRFMNIHPVFRRLEIGFTFYARSAQRTHVNTSAKYLMLEHAFETWQMNRVELLTDVRNQRSRAAIARIGAVQEGVLRSHMQMRDGHVRDSVLFAIIRDDWPAVRARLEARIARGATDAAGADPRGA